MYVSDYRLKSGYYNPEHVIYLSKEHVSIYFWVTTYYGVGGFNLRNIARVYVRH